MSFSRRRFVTELSKASAGAYAFTIVPPHVLGRRHRAPSDTLNVACIGVGGMGYNDVVGMSNEIRASRGMSAIKRIPGFKPPVVSIGYRSAKQLGSGR